VQSPSHVELGRQAQESRCQNGDQIVAYPVGYRFVIRAFIAVRPDIELEGLQFNARSIRYVFEKHFSEVGLTGFRAQAGEFRHANPNAYFPIHCGVREGFKQVPGGLFRAESNRAGHAQGYADDRVSMAIFLIYTTARARTMIEQAV
jgi:hypothetical protein